MLNAHLLGTKMLNAHLLYLIQENYQVSSDRLIRVRSEQPDHLFSNSESTSGPQKSVKSSDLCVFKRLDEKKYIVGRVIQFSYLLGNKRERQYSANYVDLSKDSYKTIGVFATWYKGSFRCHDEHVLPFNPFGHVFTTGYLSMEQYLASIDISVLKTKKDASFAIPFGEISWKSHCFIRNP